jgi:hypothetical protein
MNDKMLPADQVMVGSLLEDGEHLTGGLATLHPAGTGTFQGTEPPVTPKPDANHVIKDLEGNLWPIADLCIDSDSPSPRYKLTHTIRYFEVPIQES